MISLRHIPYHFCLAIFLCAPLPVFATPAITCHCFTDRSYDAARPTAADPYFLANAQNSFLAAAYKVDKKSIVLSKQRGTSSDDLWLAHGIASRSGRSADSLLQTKQTKASWNDVLAHLGINTKSLGGKLAGAAAARQPDARLAEAVVDDLLVNNRLLDEQELSALRRSGGTNQEVIISSLLAIKTKKTARQLLQQVKSGSTSWGGLMSKAGMEPASFQKEFSVLLKSR
ncbi:hypothetical protein [Geobacter sp. DSM 9736]|uniref:hypothetical protein n=1 Tax=Geobacter sp. DSM 9736 TaxID=1277350 RepID=UPI000B50F8D2|nr:hypothetical protein [Geobacter sp. DSM 9736]SNB45202.1 hypothetical protein SAMN06269301_0605 [Geobacter sp. DSM 9736]